MKYTEFPERVWEPVGHDKNGKLTWASRPAEREDILRRQALIAEMCHAKERRQSS